MRQSGVTLLELMVTITIIMVLASWPCPSKVSGKRAREIELRQDSGRSRRPLMPSN